MLISRGHAYILGSGNGPPHCPLIPVLSFSGQFSKVQVYQTNSVRILFLSSEKIHRCLSNSVSKSLHFEIELTSSLLHSSLLLIVCTIAGQSRMSTHLCMQVFRSKSMLVCKYKRHSCYNVEIRAAKLSL